GAGRPDQHRSAAPAVPEHRTGMDARLGGGLLRLAVPVRVCPQDRAPHRMTAAGDVASPPGRPAMEVDPWTDRLGGLVERWPRLWTRLGNWETRLLEERITGVEVRRPIYIAGLARSGSTILLELLACHPETVTHRYRDFPLVATPWAWNWFLDRAGAREQVARERAHRDRIAVTPESPEAFEEVIWMAFFPGLHDATRNA